MYSVGRKVLEMVTRVVSFLLARPDTDAGQLVSTARLKEVQEQMQQIMGIACPQIVYPYLRANVADIVNRAGFPPVHLAEINFQAMYEQQQAQLAAEQQAVTQ